jgi:hypothetical protein
MNLSELSDKYEIHDLLIRCMRAFDTEEWDVVRSCFHPGAIHDHETWRGSIDELIEREIVTYGQLTGNFHFAGNELIILEGDVARSEVYSVCWHRRAGTQGGPEVDLVSGMQYLDRLEKRSGEWRIADRLVKIAWHRADPVTPYDFAGFLAPTNDRLSPPTSGTA